MIQRVDIYASDSFTPRDFQVVLYEEAKNDNIVCCLPKNAGKNFIAATLVRENAIKLCSKLSRGGKRAVFVSRWKKRATEQALQIRHHTALKVANLCKNLSKDDTESWKAEIEENHVLVMTYPVFGSLLGKQLLTVDQISIVVFDDCHFAVDDPGVREKILRATSSSGAGPHVLCLTTSVTRDKCRPWQLAAVFHKLEENLNCTVHSTDAVLSSLQHAIQPTELICEIGTCKDPHEMELEILERAKNLDKFLRDHRYDPAEYYGDEDYVKEIPDPLEDPLQVLDDFKDVVHNFGIWGADRAALVYLTYLEKQKTRAVYERHYLLLCLLVTFMLEIRVMCEDFFQKHSDQDRIVNFTRPKIVRLLEILRLYAPAAPKSVPEPENLTIGESSASTNRPVVSQLNGDNPEIPATEQSISQMTSTDSRVEVPVEPATSTDETGKIPEDTSSCQLAVATQADSSVPQLTSIDAKEEAPSQPVTSTEETGKIPEKSSNCQSTSTDAPPHHVNRRHRREGPARPNRSSDDSYQFSAIVFVHKKTTAKILYRLLKDAARYDPQLAYLSPVYTIGTSGSGSNPEVNSKEAISEERKQEEVMTRFRTRECNILVSTAVLEGGIELPACHLVVRFDWPESYRSYVQSKARGRIRRSHYVLLLEESKREACLNELVQFHAIEQLLLSKAGYISAVDEPTYPLEVLNSLFPPFAPKDMNGPRVSLLSAIVTVNRYCSKLPSDTFTRLVPVWSLRTLSWNDLEPGTQDVMFQMQKSRNSESDCESMEFYQCSLMLPINSPLRETVLGHVMPTKNLSKRSAALEVCKKLHQAGELDDNLLPLTKENFKLKEELEEEEEEANPEVSINGPDGIARPGTTKRRQYYYKEIASCFRDCYPKPGTPCYLYGVKMVLTEPIPEEQNTRGRKIYRPETANHCLGILTSKPIPKVCPFPIFTRSGEVEVSIEEIQFPVSLTEVQLERIALFQRYLFRNVLSLEKDPMIFDVLSADLSYLIVPLRKKEDGHFLDHDFADVIGSVLNSKPRFHGDEERKNYAFDLRKFQDTVVMRWYRDQERPQCFYVAEIFYDLNPQSKFPDNNYPTFEKYYREKYGINIQNLKQPLLDVDHTSARLNLLTPRYVNRKGVMLPTSSEQTKKIQRESLQQKQILVPELCSIHPIPASLWRQTVCLPCILYRLNGLLLADALRRRVANEINLGVAELSPEFQWPPLRFGWKKKVVFPLENETNPVTDTVNGTGTESSEEPEPKNQKQTGKEPKPRKNGTGGPLMDIGVWNPNSLEGKEPTNEEEYDLSDLRNVTLLGNTGGVFDTDWTSSFCDISEKIHDPNEPLGSWEESRPKSPSEFIDCYSDGYNSDDGSYLPSNDEDSDSSDDEEGDPNEYRTKEFGPKLVCKGDTAEAVEEIRPKIKEKVEEKEDEEETDDEMDLVNMSWAAVEHPEKDPEICGQLMEKHKELLLAENFVGKDQTVPITPRALYAKMDKQERVDDKKKEETQLVVKDRRRKVTSESKFTLELTKILLGIQRERFGNAVLEVPFPYSRYQIDPWEVEETVLDFSFDEQPDLTVHYGPSPSVILQAFTMSSANDGINLERLETIGDSFLKYAVTTYLYCRYTNIHEGKLSYLRSRQVSNYHLYHLGKKKNLGGSMVATKFNPHDNWLPPGYVIPESLEEALISSGVPLNYWNVADLQGMEQMSSEEVKALVKEKSDQILARFGGEILITEDMEMNSTILLAQDLPRFVPYNLLTQHSIPDKSVADCVEALIGAYLTACGPRGALLFMSWLGLKVLPQDSEGGYRFWIPPPTPPRPVDLESPQVLRSLDEMLAGYEQFEKKINYRFRNRCYLLQAFSHASYYSNRLTDCYQRLEFLGDAVLDYLITRYLYEDPRQHPPGALTDLRSALVNNTTFAVLAVRYDFHRYFKHYSHSLSQVMEKFIRAQEENGHCINEEYFLIEEGECEEAEDVEVPKALGDVFESVAGAIYLDSGMSLDAVWRVYYRMMKNEIDEFAINVPKSPIRELLELETDRVKFGKAERLPDGRVRVTVEVIGKGTFKGIGRNYRIAKCTAAKFALRTLERRKMLAKRGE